MCSKIILTFQNQGGNILKKHMIYISTMKNMRGSIDLFSMVTQSTKQRIIIIIMDLRCEREKS
jgi:hypothetical protein